MSLVDDGNDDWAPKPKEPERSEGYESARLKIMMDAAAAPRETWEEYKAKEKAVSGNGEQPSRRPTHPTHTPQFPRAVCLC
eukprot:SAG22_NODE_2628_length_2360_cov_1.812030_2_plen_81_part_00